MTISRVVPMYLKGHLVRNVKSIIDVKNLFFRYRINQNYYGVRYYTFRDKRGEWLSIRAHNGR